MNLRRISQYGIGGAIGSSLAGLAGVVLFFTPPGKGLVQLSYNLLFVPRSHIPVDEVVMVYIDDESHEKLKQSYTEPWDRSLHAKLVDRLTEAGAKAIVFDVVFSDAMTNNPAGDEALATAIKKSERVILAADYVSSGRDDAKGRRVVVPYEPFDMVAADIGIAETYPDSDFVVRRHFAGGTTDLISHLTWAAAEFVEAKITTTGEDDKFAERWINYYGPPGWLPNVSYYRVISDIAGEQPDWETFRDKTVFVGARIVTWLQGQRKDEYRSPYSFWVDDPTQSKFMPGVEVQATVFSNLMRQDWLVRMPRYQDASVILLYGLIFGFLLAQFRPFLAAAVGVSGMVFIVATSFYAFSKFYIWSPWMIVVGVQIPLALLWSVLFNSVNLFVQKRLMEQSLSMYVSPKRVRQITKSQEMLKPGAEKQELSILFSDIANFTTFSEGMDSDELARLMNSYFEMAVGQCIHKAEGTVVKFIGDAIFAIWNAPEPQLHHQELACRGALLLRDSVNQFQFPKAGMEVRTRIGLHCGVANVGNFGSSTRIDYTALGENINLASRMEGLNKYLGTDVVITGEVQEKVKAKFVTRYVARLRLKGFEQRAVDVHELVSELEKAEESRAWRESYAAALKQFQMGDFDTAEAGLRRTLEIHEKDGPSQFLLKHIKELRAHPPEKWDGILELHEK